MKVRVDINESDFGMKLITFEMGKLGEDNFIGIMYDSLTSRDYRHAFVRFATEQLMEDCYWILPYGD